MNCLFLVAIFRVAKNLEFSYLVQAIPVIICIHLYRTMYCSTDKANLLQQYHKYTKENERCKGDNPLRLAQVDMTALSSAQKKKHALKLMHRRSTLATERALRMEYTTHCVAPEDRDIEHDWQMNVELPRLICIYAAMVSALDPAIKARLRNKVTPEHKPLSRPSVYSPLGMPDEEQAQVNINESESTDKYCACSEQPLKEMTDYRQAVVNILETEKYYTDVIGKLQSHDMKVMTEVLQSLMFLSMSKSMRALLPDMEDPDVCLDLVLEVQRLGDLYSLHGEQKTFKRREALLQSALMQSQTDDILTGNSLSGFEEDLQQCCQLRTINPKCQLEDILPNFGRMHRKRKVQLETTVLKTYWDFLIVHANLIINDSKNVFLQRYKRLFETPGITMLEALHIRSCILRVMIAIEDVNIAEVVWRYATWG